MESIWMQTCEIEKRPALEQHICADVAVIGGGMAGLLTAWQLEQAGIHAVVLEAERIGGGQTKNTTAKITSQHGLFCNTFIEKKGQERARKYVSANQAAVEEYKRIVKEEKIECDLRECDAYVYSMDIEKLKKETRAAQKLGIHASLEERIEIPISCAGAVRFPNQAQFHPLKFMDALAKKLTVYEDTKVIKVEDKLLKTTHGSVSAEKIVFTTHYPFVDFPGIYFPRMHQERSYVLALENAGSLSGMYIGAEKDMFSFRQYDKYILLGGQSHRTGENQQGQCYEMLKTVAKEIYPESRVAACWSAQDCITTDKVPFVGQYAINRPNWFVATGFQKWGMSSSMVSAMLLRDIICGVKNQYAKVFAPFRFSTEEVPMLIKDGGKSVKGLTKRFFHIPNETITALEPGSGAVVRTSQGKVGVYKSDEGVIYQVDIVCPHLGCELAWNPDDKSWDCPCHGSRFDCEGKLLDGPAQKDSVNI